MVPIGRGREGNADAWVAWRVPLVHMGDIGQQRSLLGMGDLDSFSCREGEKVQEG